MIAIFNNAKVNTQPFLEQVEQTWQTNHVKRMSYLVGLQANKLNIIYI